MKKYYIDRVTTYSTTINKKSDELAYYVYNMYSFSLVDEQSMKHIIDNIHAKAKELDEAYPRTKPTEIHKMSYHEGVFLSANPETNQEKTIFQLYFKQVLKEFQYDSNLNACNLIEEKGGGL